MLRTGKLTNVKHTGTLMVRLADKYRSDVAPFGHLTPQQFFDKIKNIPYNRDPHATEFLQRPYFTLAGNRPGGDCDDKAICIGAYAILHGYPFRFVAMAKNPNTSLHHVATDVMMGGQYVHLDPTYNQNIMGQYLFQPSRSLIIGVWHGKIGST